MAYLFTGSSNSSSISTGLSTQVIIEVNNQRVGAIQRFTPRQNRPIRGIPEVGTDGMIEKVPHQPTDVTVDVERIVFDRLSLPAAFARQFENISAQRVPFDVKIYDKSNVVSPFTDDASAGEVSLNADGLVTHVYKNCWFQSLQTTYQAGDYIISQSATISCEFVRSFQGQNQSAVDGGLRGIIADSAGGNIERIVDRGRRGSLDNAGLATLLSLTS